MTLIQRKRASYLVFTLTAFWLAVLVVSLHTGWLSRFFFDTDSPHVQGMDFFPVERAFLNFTHHISQYDTFRIPYGPRASWYLYHPAMALIIGPPLAAFSPWTAYRLWVAISIALLALSAFLIAKQGGDPLRRALVFTLLLGSFPGFILLYSGNVQAIIVLAFTLIFVALESLRRTGSSRRAQAMLTTGLLLSLFSKPFVLAMFPLLLLLRETRRAALYAVAAYIAVSALFLEIPALNPVALPWHTRLSLLTHPGLVATVLNPYVNGWQVLPPMQDNFVHWLAMNGLNSFRLTHIDVFSLPSLLDALHGSPTPGALYLIPGILLLEISLLVALMRTPARRLEAALLTCMAAALLVFTSYSLVWEYHYTALLPLGALLLVRGRLAPIERIILALVALEALPSLYIFLRGPGLNTSSSSTALLCAERVLPAVLIFLLLLARATQLALTDPTGLRWLSVTRRTASAEEQSLGELRASSSAPSA